MTKPSARVNEDFRDIVPRYFANRRKDLPVLRAAIEAADFETLRRLGHNLKGNAGGYGFHELGFVGARIEEAAKAQDLAAARIGVDEIERYIEEVTVEYVPEKDLGPPPTRPR